MIQIRGSSADDLFKNISNTLLEKGHESAPRGLKTIELDNAWLTLDDARRNIVWMPERGMSSKYVTAEMNWYLTGTYDVNEIGPHSKFWYGLQDDNGQVNSNYGQIALRDKNEHGMTQYNWCLERLREDPETRQAVINYNQPRHKKSGTKDFPCTLTQTFKVDRETGKLDSMTVMRSNDLIFGLTYDLPWFTVLQSRMANDLELNIGKYEHLAQSLHVYEKHFGMLEAMANADIERFK